MNSVFFIVLRRMRTPLILVIAAFAISVFGLALLPGVDEAGNPAPPMSLFHAFYVMLYTAATVGFGEWMYGFSDAQRMWVIVSIFLTVTAWAYALVSVLALLQEQGFQQAVRTTRFIRRMRHLHEPFYIVCGYGNTGKLVAHGLDDLGYRIVIIDQHREHLQELMVEDFTYDPITSVADAAHPHALERAGLHSDWCRGVIALTDDDDTNAAVTVSVRLLRPRLPVLARIHDTDSDISLASFGADIVINPFERFAHHLVAAVSTPERYHVRELLTALSGDVVPERYRPPEGHWIVCGYGRFGHAIVAALRRADMSVTVIDQKYYDEGTVAVEGSGTLPEELREAGISHAVGLVAGNDRDTKNLTIAVTARQLKPDIFLVTRQNREFNADLFDAFADDYVMVPSKIVASEFLSVITTPQLSRFLTVVNEAPEPWCSDLAQRLEETTPGLVPDAWTVRIDRSHAGAIERLLRDGEHVRIGHLLADPSDRATEVAAVALMLERDGDIVPLPNSETRLRPGDAVLFSGSPVARRQMELTALNANVLEYVLSGQEGNTGTLWKWARRQRALRRRRREAQN